jgi:NhaP-type Na+/H+ or K+/H+ antiporter
VRALLIGESGANDGLALPYLMLPIYLVRRTDPSNAWSSLGAAIGHW